MLVIIPERRAACACATYPDKFILAAGRQIPTVRTEANASDIEIAAHINRVIGKMAELLARQYVENLCRPFAASCNVFPIVAESHAADDALVME